MHPFLIFAVFLCIFSHARTKPLRALDGLDRDTGEVEYENNEEREADDYAQDDGEAQTDDHSRRINEQQDSILDNRTFESNSCNRQEPSEGSRNDKSSNTNVDSNLRPILKYRQPDGYSPHNEQESSHHLSEIGFITNPDQKPSYDNNIDKRAMLSLNSNEEGDFLFRNHKEQDNKLHRSEYERENTDTNMQTRHSKQFYNVPVGNRDLSQCKNYQKFRLNINRDRRQIQKANDKETNEPTLPPEENENEETAIKRHIKKLSEQELEELFNSLSEDKRNILKKILENDFDNDNENKNKREITKKAGAVEENFIENGQLDCNKNQGLSSNVIDINTESSVSQKTNLDNNKRTMSTAEIEDGVASKNPISNENSEITAKLINQNEDGNESKSENNLNLDSKKSEIDLMSNSHIVTKIENKRAANVSDLTNIIKTSDAAKSTGNHFNPNENKGSENNQELFSNNGESEFINEETERHAPHKNTLKREVYLDESSNYSDSLKSLEESFPNIKAYDESNSFLGAEMEPLVRVKRRNAESAMVKREANIKADTNIPYFPNKGENDDEDNDEGSEFDDDGFYDRTSNYARNNVNKPFDSNCPKTDDRILKLRSGHYEDSENNILSSDTMSLGSDTDNVMTGMEGVNDNLMYSSGVRNRRGETSEQVGGINDSSNVLNDVTNERCLRSTPLQDSETGIMSENTMNFPGYQENDAFGPLSRNYDGDLGRFKRIRRVKQIPSLQENAS